MRYAPIDLTSRAFIGSHWTKKQLAALNVILNVTKGVVMKEEDFFHKAYGRSPEEFLKILAMPSEFIKYRRYFEDNELSRDWNVSYDSLTKTQRKTLLEVLSVPESDYPKFMDKIIPYYHITKSKYEKKANNDIHDT